MRPDHSSANEPNHDKRHRIDRSARTLPHQTLVPAKRRGRLCTQSTIIGGALPERGRFSASLLAPYASRQSSGRSGGQSTALGPSLARRLRQKRRQHLWDLARLPYHLSLHGQPSRGFSSSQRELATSLMISAPASAPELGPVPPSALLLAWSCSPEQVAGSPSVPSRCAQYDPSAHLTARASPARVPLAFLRSVPGSLRGFPNPRVCPTSVV